MKDEAFGVCLALMMVSDPWPLQTGKSDFEEMLDDESRKRGFSDWIHAYHEWPTPN